MAQNFPSYKIPERFQVCFRGTDDPADPAAVWLDLTEYLAGGEYESGVDFYNRDVVEPVSGTLIFDDYRGANQEEGIVTAKINAEIAQGTSNIHHWFWFRHQVQVQGVWRSRLECLCRYNLDDSVYGEGYTSIVLKSWNEREKLRRSGNAGGGRIRGDLFANLERFYKNPPAGYDYTDSSTYRDWYTAGEILTINPPQWIVGLKYDLTWFDEHDFDPLWREGGHSGWAPWNQQMDPITVQDFLTMAAQQSAGWFYDDPALGIRMFSPFAYTGEYRELNEKNAYIFTDRALLNYNIDGIINQVRTEIQTWGRGAPASEYPHDQDPLLTRPSFPWGYLGDRDWTVRNEESIAAYGLRESHDDFEYVATWNWSRGAWRQRANITSLPVDKLLEQRGWPMRIGTFTVPTIQPTQAMAEALAFPLGAWQLHLGNVKNDGIVLAPHTINARVFVGFMQWQFKSGVSSQTLTYVITNDVSLTPDYLKTGGDFITIAGDRVRFI